MAAAAVTVLKANFRVFPVSQQWRNYFCCLVDISVVVPVKGFATVFGGALYYYKVANQPTWTQVTRRCRELAFCSADFLFSSARS